MAALEGLPLLALGLPFGTRRFALFGIVPTAVAAMFSAEHASTPYQVDQQGQPHRPEHDEADHHQRDQRGLGQLVQSVHHGVHEASLRRALTMLMLTTFT